MHPASFGSVEQMRDCICFGKINKYHKIQCIISKIEMKSDFDIFLNKKIVKIKIPMSIGELDGVGFLISRSAEVNLHLKPRICWPCLRCSQRVHVAQAAAVWVCPGGATSGHVVQKAGMLVKAWG